MKFIIKAEERADHVKRTIVIEDIESRPTMCNVDYFFNEHRRVSVVIKKADLLKLAQAMQ